MMPLLLLATCVLLALASCWGCWKVRRCWQAPLTRKEKVVIGISAGVVLLVILWVSLGMRARLSRAKRTAVEPELSQAEPDVLAQAEAAKPSGAEPGEAKPFPAEPSQTEQSWARLNPAKPSRAQAGYSKKDREEYERRWQVVYREVGPPPSDDCIPVLGYRTAQGVEYASYWRRAPNSSKKDNLKP